MKKQFNSSLILLFLFSAIGLQAQVRYLDQVFSSVEVTADVNYATNITVLLSPPTPQPLTMDVYSPVGDDDTNRPVVALIHTGSFLPQYINGQATGGKKDSSIVEIATRLAKMGYVVVTPTYRQGWIPTASGPTGQNTRTGTLLQAAYRGIQDVRACIRFLRKTVAEDENLYGIDPSKIAVWGMGTGGYVSQGAAFLDDFEEVILDKFIDTETLLPYVDTTILGNPYGTTEKPLCLANWPEYSSEFNLAVNMGGALGDLSWIDGPEANPNEPALIGLQVPTDPLAPFGNGPVIVPTTGDFVVFASGSRTAVDTANVRGTNAVLDPVSQLVNFLNLKVQALKPVPFQFPGQEATTLATDHMYPFIANPANSIFNAPWEWYDSTQMAAEVAFVNLVANQDIDPDTIYAGSELLNPGFSKAKATAYIDTAIAFYTPRACAALGLDDCLTALGLTTDVEEIVDDNIVELQLGPNPAREEIFFRTNFEHPMQEIRVFDVKGLMVQSHLRINAHQYNLERRDLPPGIYLARIRFKEGILTKKIVFH